MTEYEVASLALAETRVGIMQTQVWVAALVGLLQCSLIAGGLWLMRKAAPARDHQHQEAQDRHAETMRALDQQATASREQHAATLEALRQQGEALRTLIERTAPGTGPSQMVSDGHDYQRQEPPRHDRAHVRPARVALSREAARRAPTKGEIEQTLRIGASSTRQQLQALCDRAAQVCTTFTAYVERLEAVGVAVIPTVQQHGAKLSGLQYCLDGVIMKGSALGKAYAAAGIQTRGIRYEKDRDYATVERCRKQARARKRARDDFEWER